MCVRVSVVCLSCVVGAPNQTLTGNRGENEWKYGPWTVEANGRETRAQIFLCLFNTITVTHRNTQK